MGSKVLRAIDSLELCLLHGFPRGGGSNAGPTNIDEMRRSGFASLSRSLPRAISNGAGEDSDTSSASPVGGRGNPYSTLERKKTLRDAKTRNPHAFPVICHLFVRSGVVGEPA